MNIMIANMKNDKLVKHVNKWQQIKNECKHSKMSTVK